MSYTRWKAEQAAWRSIPAGAKGVRLLMGLTLALPVALLMAGATGKTSNLGPLRDGILGVALGLMLVSVFVTPVILFVHSLHGHHRLGWGLLAVGIASALVFTRMLLMRPD